MKVGYQGVHGAFSEMACLLYFKDQAFEQVCFKDFISMFEAVAAQKIDYALFPVENTTTGLISRTYDYFQKYDVHVVGEINVPIIQNLIVLPNTKLEEIREVYSHPEALSQCANFFQKHRGMKEVAYEDTALAVEYIKQCKDPSKAAIASSRAAEYYGMEILQPSVQENDFNMTRFLCVTKEEEIVEGANKISIRMVLPHVPGALYSALGLFASKNINVVKLESRPIIGKLFEYCFYVDFMGNREDPDVKETLRRLEYDSLDLQIFGNYKAAEIL